MIFINKEREFQVLLDRIERWRRGDSTAATAVELLDQVCNFLPNADEFAHGQDLRPVRA